MATTDAVHSDRIGIWASLSVFALICAYLAVLTIGLASLPSPDEPIAGIWLTAMEILILALMPVLVLMIAAIHERADRSVRTLSLCAVVFATLTAGLTMTVHFALLTAGRSAAFADAPWWGAVFAFRWPSAAYVLDIVAWDIFYPLAMFLAAPAVGAGRGGRPIRILMVLSDATALAGAAGAVTGDMQLRNVGIAGYTILLLPIAWLLHGHFGNRARNGMER